MFIDEIHRFNKGQQDALLGAVEKGDITLIGATTENPSFEVNAALLSRSQVYTLKALNKKDLTRLLEVALTKDAVLSQRKVELEETEALFNISGGDARKLLNLLDLVLEHVIDDPAILTNEVVKSVAQQRVATYDKSGICTMISFLLLLSPLEVVIRTLRCIIWHA